MAYFEIQVEPDGVDAAQLIDSDEWMIAAESGGLAGRLDVFVWNGSDTPVDVYLVAGHVDLQFVKDPDHYDDAQTEEQYRSVTDGRIPGDNVFLDIRGLGPGSFFPFRISNPLPGGAREWLDQDSCRMSTAGHGTNIFNGQRVYVIGHHTE